MSTLQINNQHKRKQTLPERMFATTGASQARSPITMGALAPWDANCRRQTQRFAAVMFVFVFLAFGVYLLHPFAIDNSYAETATGTASAEMSVNLDPTITIWTTDTNNNNIDSINIAADPDESVYTGAGRVHVSTNNLTGYTLTIQSNSTDAKMKHENTSVTKTIDPLTSSGTSASSWAGNSSLNNMWGYSLGSNDSYVGVPGSSSTATTIDSTVSPNNDNYTDITFATKADLSLPAGTYKDTVIFSAVANDTPSLWLQDMTVSDCAALPVYDSSRSAATTYTRYDRRDGQPYKIRRLYMTPEKVDSPSTTACWMVENLRLTGERVLTPNDSNIDTNFTLTASDDSVWCTENSSECDDKSMVISTDYGALYNWYAATAGTGTYGSGSGAIVTASICPGKGAGTGPATKTWHLPTGNTNNEWYNLFAAYQSEYGWTTIYGTSSSGTMTKTWNQDIGPAFIYSGLRYGAYTNGQSSTGNGLWWSSMAYDNNYAFVAFLNYGDRYVFGADGNRKYLGLAVRCVLPAE